MRGTEQQQAGMKLEIGKFYKTRGGHKVRIYATDGADNKIHGAILSRDGWRATNWQADGTYLINTDDAWDIIAEWKEPKLRPWRPEEVPVGAQVQMRGFRGIITGVGITHVVIGCHEWGLDALAEAVYSLDDGETWLPCGVEE